MESFCGLRGLKYSQVFYRLNLLNAKATLATEELFAWTIVVVLLSLIFEKYLDIILKKYFEQKGSVSL